MKRSEELLGLSVISIEDGKEIGRVSDFVINSAKGMVEFLIIDNGYRYMGIKILPFKMVEGVGEYAVTILSSTSITDLSDEPEVNGLLEKNVRVKGTKVLTRKGKLIGSVSEFLIDDGGEGKISGCEVAPTNNTGQSGIIPADQIVTFGKDVVVVHEDAMPTPPSSPDTPAPPDTPVPPNTPDSSGIPDTSSRPSSPGSKTSPTTKSVPSTPTASDLPSVTPAKTNIPSASSGSPEQQEAEEQPETVSQEEDKTTESADKQEPSQAAKLFEERQRKYLLGRKAGKSIETESGEVVAEEGDIITNELLDKAKAAGKFTELSMNTRA